MKTGLKSASSRAGMPAGKKGVSTTGRHTPPSVDKPNVDLEGNVIFHPEAYQPLQEGEVPPRLTWAQVLKGE